MDERDLERLAAAGVYGPSDGDATVQRALLERMVAHGLSVDELAATPRLGGLVLRVFDQIIQPGTRLTLEQVARESSVPADVVLQVRRAQGFPDPAAGEACFVPADVEGLRFIGNVGALLGQGVTMHMVRAVGTATSRIAEAQIALIRSQLEGRMEVRAASVASILCRYEVVIQAFLPAFLGLMETLLRAHLVHIGRRYTGSAGPPSEHNVLDMVVGFADLTHSTALVRRLDLAGLDRALTTFEEVTTDLIAGGGATLVKRLGDGVMFVTPSADLACALARRLVDAFREHPSAPPARVGLAAGQVAALRGDFYGPPVHLAARIVTVTPPATILMSGDLRARLSGVATRPAGWHALAGFDPIELYELLP